MLKPGGSIFVNLGDKYGRPGGGADVNPRNLARSGKGTTGRQRTLNETGTRDKCLLALPQRYMIRCIDELGLICRAEIIWNKPNGLPESVTDRVRRAHETWLHFVKQPRYYAGVDAIREAHECDQMRGSGARFKAGTGRNDVVTMGEQRNPLGKLPGSVWTIATQPLTVPAHLGVDHFAAFPMEWPRRIIQGWSPEGGVVVDPFGGTGTTALVADVLGRRGISVDMSADYCRLARWRTTDPGQIAAAMQVEKPPKERDGQLDLFAEEGAA